MVEVSNLPGGECLSDGTLSGFVLGARELETNDPGFRAAANEAKPTLAKDAD
jgi:hypothetical protein